MVPWIGLHSLIVPFPGHTQLLFLFTHIELDFDLLATPYIN